MEYKQKYLKYKLKYLLLKQQEEYVFTGGMEGVQKIFRRVDAEEELAEELKKFQIADAFISTHKKEELDASILIQFTPMQIGRQTEIPGAPKGERPKEILDIIYNRLEDIFELKDTIDTIEELKKGVLNEAIFEKLFDTIFQLSDTDDEQIMILNLVLFIKDLEHDYNNYLKDSKPAEGDRTIILIEKCIKKLNEKIELEGYSFNIEMLSDEMLRQGTAVKERLIMPTYASLLSRGILDKDFHFKKPVEEYDFTNILQDQGYNPTGIAAQRIELDGLCPFTEEKLLGTDLDKKNIYKFITERWLKYIFTSLCRLEMLYLNGNNLYIIQYIFSLIMKKIEFNVTINEAGTVWELQIIYKDIGIEEVKVVDISSKGITKNAFKFMHTENMEEFSKKIIIAELNNLITKHGLEQEEVKIIIKILWTRLRDIFKLVFASLKSLGDKTYEFLLVIFVMRNFEYPNAEFLIETRDNHFINSLFANIIPLIKLLKINFAHPFNLGLRFPINKDLLKKYSLPEGDKSIIFTHNQTFYSPTLSPSHTPLKEDFKTPSSPSSDLVLPRTPPDFSPMPTI